MNNFRSRLRTALLGGLAAGLMTSLPLSAADLKMGGTGNAIGTMRLLAEAFARANPAVKPMVLDSIGTSGALKALPKGAIDIGLSSRALSEEESRNGLTATEYARSPTVFAVNTKIQADSISLAQIADIYLGKMNAWPDGVKIRPVIRQPGDDNTKQIKSLSPEIEKAVVFTESQPGLAFAATDQEAADKMENIPGSLGVTTLALIRSEKRNLKALSLGGVAPTSENARSGKYPMTKHFYAILPKEPSATALEFIKFVKSPAGRKILEETGHYIP